MLRIMGAAKRALDHYLRTPAERRHALVGPAELWKMKREFQIKFLKQVGLTPQHYLLDIGCGTLRGGIPIIDLLGVGHYYGIERRAAVLEEGRKELEESGLSDKQPQLLLVEDIASLKLRRKFDYIWAFSVLIHMEDATLLSTLGFVREHLEAAGCFYANVRIGDEPDGEWQGFPLVSRSLEFYREACAGNGLRLSDVGSLNELGHPGGSPEQRRMLKMWKA